MNTIGKIFRAQICAVHRSEEHTSELQSQSNLVCRLLLEKKKTKSNAPGRTNLRRTSSAVVIAYRPTSIRTASHVPVIAHTTLPAVICSKWSHIHYIRSRV